MKRSAILLALGAALSGAACGEITAFCMTAGAPSGMRLVITNTPRGMVCSYQPIADSLPPRPTPNPTGQAGGQARLSAATLDFIARN
jgi:hypothetical protein